MHQALDRAFCVVADRIVGLRRIADELAAVGDELARDRIVRIAGVDEASQRRRQADRVARGDRLELAEPRRIGEARRDELFGVVRRRGFGLTVIAVICGERLARTARFAIPIA